MKNEIKCPLCEALCPHETKRNTHFWKCPECSFIGLEYNTSENIADVYAELEDGYIITSVSKDDLTNQGFRTENLTDDDMFELASKMTDAYMNVFWDDLDIIAGEMIKKE